MAKLPKFSDLTDVSGMVNKMKSAIDNLTGPSTSSATEEALAQESDPTKAKFLEVELLINQLHDLTVIQNKTISELQTKYAEVKVIADAALKPQEEEQEAPKATDAAEPSQAEEPTSDIAEQPTESEKPTNEDQ